MRANQMYAQLGQSPMDPPLALRVRIAVLIFLYFELGYQANPAFGYWDSVDMSTWLDFAMPKIPEFIVFYTLGYFIPILPCFLVKDKAHFVAGTLGYVGILTTSFVLFRCLPIPLDKDLAQGTDFFSLWMRFQQDIDTNVNNFPSLHVSLNVFALMMLRKHHRLGYLICLPLTLGVVLSTLVIKQHYVLDAVGGVLLALSFYRLHPYLLPLSDLFITPYFGHRAVSTKQTDG